MKQRRVGFDMKRLLIPIMILLGLISTPSFAQRTFTRDYLIEVQRGNISGVTVVHKFGRNDAVASATWEGIGLLSEPFTFLTGATTVKIKAGGHANDDASGSGAQSVLLVGLDSNGNEVEETLITAGAAESADSNTSFWRVYRIYIPDGGVGTYGGANAAAITIENSGGGTDLIMIATDEGQSQYGAYAIPSGNSGFLLSVEVEADTAKPADFRMFTRSNLTDASTPFSPKRIRLHFDGIDGPDTHDPNSPMFVMDELTDIWMEAEGAGNNTEVSVDMEILLIKQQ